MLVSIKQQLKNHPIIHAEVESLRQGSVAAVLLVLHGHPNNPKLVLTERAAHLNNHGGEVAFPGGMWDMDDDNLWCTAVRETEEEIGLSASQIEPIAMLPNESPRRRNIQVTPFVAWADSPLKLTPDPREIASVFHMPLSVGTEIDRYGYFKLAEASIELPYLEYSGYKIWGFTLKVIVDMLNITTGAQIKLRYPNRQQLEQLGY
jgi:8-oxo-dGTP pyrophosphatase MutT (NUDIX family)